MNGARLQELRDTGFGDIADLVLSQAITISELSRLVDTRPGDLTRPAPLEVLPPITRNWTPR